MRNRDKPASPATTEHTAGLSKREAAAIAAMQGILANGEFVATLGGIIKREGPGTAKILVELAVSHADDLFDELEKGDG